MQIAKITLKTDQVGSAMADELLDVLGVIESNIIHHEKNESSGVQDPDSGGTSIYLSPGLQYVTKRWIFEGIVQVPVAQNLGGSALEDDYTVRLGVRVNF